MTSAITLNSNIMKKDTATRKDSIHFTPIVPKRKLSLQNNITTSNTSTNNNDSLNNKRYNKNNNNANSTLTIRTSKRWVLPPRPRPGRKTFFNSNNTTTSSSSNSSNNNNNNNNSMSGTSSIISSTSSSTYSSPVSVQSSNSSTSTVFSHGNKRRNQSVPTISNVKREHNNNNNFLNQNNLSKKNSSNYLAFLKFDDESSSLNLPSIDENENKYSILSSISSQKDHNITPTNSNSSNISTTQKSKSIPRDISPSDTIVATPNNEKCISLNKLQNFTYNNISNNNLLADFNLDHSYNISSTSLISSFAFNLPNPNDQNSNNNSNNKKNNNNNNDDFIERTTNDELENEIYNNIWKFLPRYNKSLDNDTTKNTNINDNVVSNNNNDNASTARTNVDDNDSYFYSAPTLEELMDEQDNNFSNFNNINFSLQDLQ